MYITMCLYITITILLWVLSIYHFIKHYTIIVSIITIQFSDKYHEKYCLYVISIPIHWYW